MIDKPVRFVLFLLIWSLVTSACTLALTPEAPNMANPASVHCVDQGGTVDIRTDDDGGQVGYCQFDDGSECEEWAFLRGDCQPGEFPTSTQLANPASVYCGEEGGTTEIRSDDSGQYGVCVFDDGSECEEWALFRGECAPGATE